jgi:hypothetical protein
MVAYSLGDRCRAIAQARLAEVAPQVFIVIPWYLREVGGPNVPWQSPEPGHAIETTSSVTNFEQAHEVLAWWATRTYALNRHL